MQRVLSVLVVAWSIAGVLHAGPEDYSSKAPVAAGSNSAGAGIGPAAARPVKPAPPTPPPKKAPDKARPDAEEYSFKVWNNPVIAGTGNTVSANTPYGRLTCTNFQTGRRFCAWE
jgi:hypothetical protein